MITVMKFMMIIVMRYMQIALLNPDFQTYIFRLAGSPPDFQKVNMWVGNLTTI